MESQLYRDIKAQNFAPNRRGLFHYVLFAHDHAAGTVGEAETLGDDVLVTLECPGGRGWVEKQAGVLMHELGHNLNLGHGGGVRHFFGLLTGPDDTNCKPNHPSVMNYRFTTRGVSTEPWGIGLISYSSVVLADLDEDFLDGRRGIEDGPFVTYYGCDANLNNYASGDTPVDWNCFPPDLTEHPKAASEEHFKCGHLGSAGRKYQVPPSRLQV